MSVGSLVFFIFRKYFILFCFVLLLSSFSSSFAVGYLLSSVCNSNLFKSTEKLK